MLLWRISNYADLSGEGGRRSDGRWHEQGRSVVYLAEHPALALLEVLVHLEIDPDDLPSSYQLLTVEVPDGLKIEALRPDDPTEMHPHGGVPSPYVEP
jgi:RES domain-containing protein